MSVRRPYRLAAMLAFSVLAHAAALHGVRVTASGASGRSDDALALSQKDGQGGREKPGASPDMPRATLEPLSVATQLAGVTANQARLHAERRELLAAAREALRGNRLELGRFLLRANRIDAEEQGQRFDFQAALADYEARLEDLRSALRDEPVRSAVPQVFGDLSYYGQP